MTILIEHTFTVGFGSLVLETDSAAGVESSRTVSIVVKAVWVESAGSESRGGSVGWHRSSVRRVDIVDRVRVVWLHVSIQSQAERVDKPLVHRCREQRIHQLFQKIELDQGSSNLSEPERDHPEHSASSSLVHHPFRNRMEYQEQTC
jgi:hypothetical protein